MPESPRTSRALSTRVRPIGPDSPSAHGSRGGTASGEAARLLVSCTDRPGIVAAVAGFLFDHGANVITSDQYSSDPEDGRFFMRISFRWPDPIADLGAFESAFAEVAARFDMRWQITWSGQRKRVMLMVSREDHCLADLLYRHHRGELDMDLLGVISNHEIARPEVEALGVPFHHTPVTRETKSEAERRQLALIGGDADLVVLARYMQILSAAFLNEVGCPVINIHHSFLPAFAGAGPYERAHARGVKLIGATAHYATVDLDEGPIIAQEVRRVDHEDTVDDLIRAGRDVERLALASALRHHLDDRVLSHDGRTIVF